ncbi:hypothetical protein EDD21DRAFT_380542 [Dissophora ornata]|nr:hypothetical protein EDD21DRAFT_380542 [Dissophora ornata]
MKSLLLHPSTSPEYRLHAHALRSNFIHFLDVRHQRVPNTFLPGRIAVLLPSLLRFPPRSLVNGVDLGDRLLLFLVLPFSIGAVYLQRYAMSSHSWSHTRQLSVVYRYGRQRFMLGWVGSIPWIFFIQCLLTVGKAGEESL